VKDKRQAAPVLFRYEELLAGRNPILLWIRSILVVRVRATLRFGLHFVQGKSELQLTEYCGEYVCAHFEL
jgi:hypothetical protein